MKTLFGISALLLCLVLTAGQAQASPIVVYNFTSDHCTGGCGTPPFGTVTLEQFGADVLVTVSVDGPLETAQKFVKTGVGVLDSQSFVFNANGVVLTDIVVSPHTPALTATAGPHVISSVGTFGFGIWCASCGLGASNGFTQDIVFTVQSATIADLTQPNAKGNTFAADVLGANGNTGAVDATVPVPDGGLTLAMLGGALLGLGGLRRAFRR